MCAPLSQQQPLAQSLQLTAKRSGWPNKEWNSGLPAWPNEQRGYVYYNLVETEADVWEALLVVELNYPPEGRPAEENTWYLAVQSVQAEREGRRWVVTPLEAFRAVETQSGGWDWGCEDLPAWRYQGTWRGLSGCRAAANQLLRGLHRDGGNRWKLVFRPSDLPGPGAPARGEL